MIGKEELVDLIEKSELERLQGDKDIWEKHIYLDDDNVLIVGYQEEEASYKQDPEEETVKNYYWYWELRDSKTWELKFENHDKEYSFCESEMGSFSDQDSVKDIVGDIDEAEICKWEEQERIEDISDYIADKVMEWLVLTK
jgi:hypothetical protein